MVSAVLSLPAVAAPAPQAQAWVFVGRVYDGSATASRNAEVVVSGERITCVAAPGGCEVPAGAHRVAMTDATLMPGLIDLHVHARPHYAHVFRKGGVTSVRDANNTFGMLDEVRGTAGAPRVFGSGPMLDGPGSIIIRMSEHAGPPGRFPIREQDLMVVSTPAEAEQAVDMLVDGGAHQVKLYEQLAPEVYRAAAARARQRGVPTMADLGIHITRGLDKAQVDALQAAAAGTSSIEHASGVALAYRRMGGDPDAPEFDAALLDRIAAALVEADVAVVPTMIGHVTLAADELPGTDEYPLASELESQLLDWWRSLHEQGAPDRDKVRRMLKLHREFMQRFIVRGGRVGAGSDVPALPMVVPGDALHHEMRLLTELGLSPVGALHAATGGAARILGSTDVGEIAPGRYADLVLVTGDPTQELDAARRIRAVWQGGQLVHGEPERIGN